MWPEKQANKTYLQFFKHKRVQFEAYLDMFEEYAVPVYFFLKNIYLFESQNFRERRERSPTYSLTPQMVIIMRAEPSWSQELNPGLPRVFQSHTHFGHPLLLFPRRLCK